MLLRVVLIPLSVLLMATVVSAQDVTLPDIDISGSPDGIVPLPNNTPEVFTNWFSMYTKVVAPNGKPIHLIAQSGWTRDQVLKARNVMEYILESFPGSEYGDNKAAVSNALADRKATMVLFNTPEILREALSGPLGSVTDLSMQDLRANECPAEGDEDYMAHITRDASFEEILHLVQDYGIRPALPKMQKEIEAAHEAMEEKELWESWGDANEYIAVILDNYLDLWTVNPTVYEGRPIEPGRIPEGATHFGAYRAANGRAMLETNDPQGYVLLEKFFPRHLTYTPQLPLDFKGTYSITYDPNVRYTMKAQHLRNVTLRGDNDANLVGNQHTNVLTGNAGDNALQGGAGDDRLNGNGGDDTAVYSGAQADYIVTKHNGFTTVRDERLNRDGVDTLTSIESVKFSDGTVEL